MDTGDLNDAYTVRSLDDLATIYATLLPTIAHKETDHITEVGRAFIAASPFLVLATSNGDSIQGHPFAHAASPEAATPATMPAAAPAAASTTPSRTNCASTSPCRAPTARRMAISRRRSRTFCHDTVIMPTAPSAKAPSETSHSKRFNNPRVARCSESRRAAVVTSKCCFPW